MKTKEEMLIDFWGKEDSRSYDTDTLELMSKYAKQEAIAYRNFQQSQIEIIMASCLMDFDKDFDETAYELYLKSKTNA